MGVLTPVCETERRTEGYCEAGERAGNHRMLVERVNRQHSGGLSWSSWRWDCDMNGGRKPARSGGDPRDRNNDQKVGLIKNQQYRDN